MTETRVIHLEDKADLYDMTNPIALSRDVYWAANDVGEIWLAHACTNNGTWDGRAKWMWQIASRHTVVSTDPLHPAPSIGWMDCCGRHGFIRGGTWEPAGDGGWFPEMVEGASDD